MTLAGCGRGSAALLPFPPEPEDASSVDPLADGAMPDAASPNPDEDAGLGPPDAAAAGADGGRPDAAAPLADAGRPDAATGADAGSITPLEQYCRALLQTSCTYDGRCGIADSASACLAAYRDIDNWRLWCHDHFKAEASGRATFDPARAAACLAYRSNQMPCELSEPNGADCDAVMVGHVPNGQPCFAALECGPSSYCNVDLNCPGICDPQIAPGGVAGISPEQCQPPGYVYDIYDPHCATPVAAGSSCAPVAPSIFQRECAHGSFCDNAQRCRAFKKLNEACTDLDRCELAMRCYNGTCIYARSLGQACSRSTEPVCKSGLYCKAAVYGNPGTCAALESTGGACYDGMDCVGDHTCVGADTSVPGSERAGTCQPKRELGQTCSETEPCRSMYYCDATCRERKPFGAACTSYPYGQCDVTASCTNDLCTPWACRDTATY